MSKSHNLWFLTCTICIVILAGTNIISAFCKPSVTYASTIPPTTTSFIKQKKIVFVSERDGFSVIYVMNDNGSDQYPLEKNNKETYVSNPRWSLNGEKVIFSLSYPVMRGLTEIHIANLDGSNNQIVVTEKNTASADPDLSPDSKYVAFVSNRDGRFGIYVMNADGSNQHRLTELESYNSPDPKDQTIPHWSPTQNTIAFLSKGDTSSAEIKIANLDGSGLQTLVHGAITFTWSPDGQSIAFVSADSSDSGNLCIVNIKSKIQTCLLNLTNVLGLGVTWSPDGRHIAFSAPHNNGYDIFVWDVEANRVQKLTDNSTYIDYQVPTNYDATWSPNSKRLSFVASDDIVAVSARTAKIYAVNTDGSDLTALTATGDMSFSPSWQP